MANAVEEAEAAQARAQEEVPTEPAISPRDSVLEVPINDGQWTPMSMLILWNVCREDNQRMPVTSILHASTRPIQHSFSTDTLRKAAQAFNSRHKLLNMKHTNEVSENGKPSSKLEDWMLHHFQAVHLRKAFHPSVYFQKSMRPFDRMIQVSLLIHSQL